MNDLRERYQNLILSDRGKNNQAILPVLRRDVFNALNNYVNLKEENFRISILPQGDGCIISINAYADRIYDCGNVI